MLIPAVGLSMIVMHVETYFFPKSMFCFFSEMDESLWFVMFQAETKPDPVESYVTPWVGTQIAEVGNTSGDSRMKKTGGTTAGPRKKVGGAT